MEEPKKETKKETMDTSMETSTETKKTINKKRIAMIAGIAVLVCIAVVVSIIALGGNSGKKLAEQLEMANRYMGELDYEAALVAYEAAIEIDPRCEDAYLGLAEVYVAMGDYEAAIKILEDGFEATGSEKIREKLEALREEIAAQEAINEQESENTDEEQSVTDSEDAIEENESENGDDLLDAEEAENSDESQDATVDESNEFEDTSENNGELSDKEESVEEENGSVITLNVSDSSNINTISFSYVYYMPENIVKGPERISSNIIYSNREDVLQGTYYYEDGAIDGAGEVAQLGLNLVSEYVSPHRTEVDQFYAENHAEALQRYKNGELEFGDMIFLDVTEWFPATICFEGTNGCAEYSIDWVGMCCSTSRAQNLVTIWDQPKYAGYKVAYENGEGYIDGNDYIYSNGVFFQFFISAE